MLSALLGPALKGPRVVESVRGVLAKLRKEGADWEQEYRNAAVVHNDLWPERPAPPLEEVAPR